MDTIAQQTFNRLPAFDRMTPRELKEVNFDLVRYQRFLDRVGNPEKGLPVIHVAGSKGKGSTSVLIGAALQALGKRVGVYMSPYLGKPTEAIFVDGNAMSDETFSRLMARYKPVIDSLSPENFVSSFEVLTTMALQHFHDEDVDFAILETGLGGRLDATNAVDSPIISVITPIEKEHTQLLGSSIASIAYEKFGIVREKTPVVIATQNDPFVADFGKGVCLQKRAECVSVGNLYKASILERSLEGYAFRLVTPAREIPRVQLALLGEHQIQNAMSAWAVLDQLLPGFEVEPVLTVWSGLTLPGRFQLSVRDGREVILDGAHTVNSAKTLRKTLDQLYGNEPITFLVAFLGDKNVDGIVRELVRWGDALVITQVDHPRSLPAREVEERVKEFCSTQRVTCAITNNLRIAWQKACKMSPRSPICVTGSFKLIEQI